MSLLRKIQDATIDPKFQLSDILRMCKILAARLDHPDFKNWIVRELDGYKNPEQVPDYRVLSDLGCRGNFLGISGHGKRFPIPPLSLPEEVRKALSRQSILSSIGELESAIDQATLNNKCILRYPWPQDFVVLLGADIYENMYCMEAWTDIPVSQLCAIFETVKSRILDFVLEIEKELPDIGETKLNDKSLRENFINPVFDRCILHINYQIESTGSTIQTHHQGSNMSDNFVNNFQSANIANMANVLQDNARQQANQYIHLPEEKQTLAEAVNEIQQLLKQLDLSYPAATEIEKVEYVNDETTPSFKRRVVGALQALGESAIDEFVLDNKYHKVIKATVKGWLQPNS